MGWGLTADCQLLISRASLVHDTRLRLTFDRGRAILAPDSSYETGSTFCNASIGRWTDTKSTTEYAESHWIHPKRSGYEEQKCVSDYCLPPDPGTAAGFVRDSRSYDGACKHRRRDDRGRYHHTHGHDKARCGKAQIWRDIRCRPDCRHLS